MCDEQSDLVPLSGQSSKGCTEHLSMPGKPEAEPQPSLRQYCSWRIRWPMMMWTSRLPRNRAICLAATKMVSTLAEAGEGVAARRGYSHFFIMHTYSESILPNKLRVITSTHVDSWINFMELWVNAGSRHENAGGLGYAHILEHMLLKGTKKWPTPYLLGLEKDRIGVYSNAQTNLEKISLTINGLSKYKDRMMHVLAEQALNSIIDEIALENEKKVILEEYKKSADDPVRHIARISQMNFFENHPLGKNILGNPESIKAVTQDSLLAYHHSFFVPSQTALIISGDIKHGEAYDMASKYFGGWKDVKSKNNFQNFRLNNHSFFEKRDISQFHIAISYNTTGVELSKRQLALSILANYLNFGYTSPLMQELRIKNGLVYQINIMNGRYVDAGRFSIQTSTTEPQKVIDIILETINSIPDKLTPSLFEEIKNQYIDGLLVNMSDFEKEISFLGTNFILRGKMSSPADTLKEIESIDRDFLMDTVKGFFVEERRHIAVLGPCQIF
ncbi:MAG: Peptidase M16 domain protein [Candidatus Yanofskybacteria bacterium GW2011_GWA2_44_10]|uniref:Peptidase M16 domain protein n=2 Tax=Candidatus Yanofskyibacteriota TaxID=1752733 RepID=A0A0G1L366_9BACT|nr:MAG: Peptidase M16 domain protein [Candidatus Yanofskybacteria bacterium GW2011_GWA2_44_10]KKT90396.1 MAG: Peptidase M16 domain protein [Candidatus Yanofskybacteria bacterium GW2011_GWB1_45_11]